MRDGDGGRRVLLVESEALVSLDLCETLQDAGYAVVGPANTMVGALFLLQREKPQLAVIDAFVKDGSCAALADVLRRSGVPFLIHSVFAARECPQPEFLDAPWLEKPALPPVLVGMLDTLTAPAAAP